MPFTRRDEPPIAASRCAVAAVLLSAAVLSAVSPGLADEPERRLRFLDAAGPPSLPGLSHKGRAFNFEYTLAATEPTDIDTGEPISGKRAFAYSARWLIDVPLVERRWYIGVSGDVAAGSVPSGADPTSGGSTLLMGNPELWIRGLWSSETGLSAGGGVAAVVPIPRSFSPLEAEVARAIRVVRPTDFAHFQDFTLTARPFFDLRHVIGRITMQMRQGMDVAVLLRDAEPNENDWDLAAFASAYIGVRTIEQLTVALEIGEVYQLTAGVTAPGCVPPCDERRVQLTISPIVRLRLPPLSPSFSMLLPLSTPLRGEVESYVAGRLQLGAEF